MNVYTLAALITAMLCAPALAQQRAVEPLANPVLTPGAPWAFDGFVVNAPADEGWASFSKDFKSAELGKKYDEVRSAAAVVDARRFPDDVVRAEDLLELTRREQSALPDPGAMALLEYEQEVFTPKGVLCVRSGARFEDRRAQYAQPGVLAVRGVSCARPDRPEIVVTLRFAERLAGVDGEPQLTSLAQAFLGSLRFVPPAGALVAQARDAVGNKRGADAVNLLKPAADAGDAEAALFLGNIYLYGSGVPPDFEAARGYLELAAREGRVDALYNLGSIYDKAIGVPRDPQRAMRWFGLAADQRDAQAQLNLALFYLRGDGVEKDPSLAEQWLRRAAGNGSKRAQGILASGRYKQQ
ncbi:MAG TPA: tetratricopeptide repeat protein [Burkholderiales bacterium]|nr:tetratricopeptide repeat protein [Burkholderiales bacterium]